MPFHCWIQFPFNAYHKTKLAREARQNIPTSTQCSERFASQRLTSFSVGYDEFALQCVFFSPGLHPQGMPRYLDLCCHSFEDYLIFRRFANDLSVPSYPRPGLTEMAKDFSKGCGREDRILQWCASLQQSAFGILWWERLAQSGTVVCRLQQGDAAKEQGTGGAILHVGSFQISVKLGLELTK